MILQVQPIRPPDLEEDAGIHELLLNVVRTVTTIGIATNELIRRHNEQDGGAYSPFDPNEEADKSFASADSANLSVIAGGAAPRREKWAGGWEPGDGVTQAIEHMPKHLRPIGAACHYCKKDVGLTDFCEVMPSGEVRVYHRRCVGEEPS